MFQNFPLLLLLLSIAAMTTAADLAPGQSVFGQHQYTEYVLGDLPLVIAAPHGGALKPEAMPTRTKGVTAADANTQELARTIASVVHERTGHHMHLIISRLHRSKLDPNREIVEAAQGSPLAEHAWKEHHDFIDRACDAAVKRFGTAFFIDLHGHGHKDLRVELGYSHASLDLAASEDVLNQPAFFQKGSLRLIAERSPLSYAELLRGPLSLGALLEKEGFPATPSPRMPVPTEPYFRGGYTVSRHCVAARHITGLQIEANRTRLRDTPANRLAFAQALVKALDAYFAAHLGFGIDGKAK